MDGADGRRRGLTHVANRGGPHRGGRPTGLSGRGRWRVSRIPRSTDPRRRAAISQRALSPAPQEGAYDRNGDLRNSATTWRYPPVRKQRALGRGRRPSSPSPPRWSPQQALWRLAPPETGRGSGRAVTGTIDPVLGLRNATAPRARCSSIFTTALDVLVGDAEPDPTGLDGKLWP